VGGTTLALASTFNLRTPRRGELGIQSMNALSLRAGLASAILLVSAVDASAATLTGQSVTDLSRIGVNLSPIFQGGSFSAVQGSELGKGWTFTLENDLLINGEDILEAGAFVYWDADPVLNYAFSIQDNGAASSFSFFLEAAVIPAATGPHSVRVDFLTVMTDGAGPGSNVDFTPNPPPTLVLPAVGINVDSDGVPEAQVLSFNRIVDASGIWTNAGYDLGRATTAAFAGSIVENITVGSRTIAWDEWRFDLNFAGTGGGDAYSITGRAEINAIPVPAAVWMLGSAVAGLVTAGRRKHA
jgi:hypothetical protein